MRGPARELARQGRVMTSRDRRTDLLEDVRADRIVVQAVLRHVAAPALDQKLERGMLERLSLRRLAPAGHGGDLVERQRLARGAQNAEPTRRHRVVRDATPQ